MKRNLFILAAIAMLCSCHIVTPEEPVKDDETAYEAVGVMTVLTSGFTKEELRVKTVLKENALLDLYMFDVKFAAAMPVTIDMLISDVAYEQKDGNIRFFGDGIVPTAGGKPYDKYIIRELEGFITADSLCLSNYYGETPSEYRGKLTNKN